MKQTGCQEYQKVLSYFYDLVKDGTLTWGSKLPTERKIAEQLGIGRNSAREAICVLHGMGVVERKQGSGNYVAENIGQSFGSMIQMLLLWRKWQVSFFWKMVLMKKSKKNFRIYYKQWLD